MELLTDNEFNWLTKHHSGLTYMPSARMIVGRFEMNAQFKDLAPITDNFEILIKLHSGDTFPSVYETGGKIKKMAKMLNLPLSELHVNSDDTLCLIRPDKIKIYYPKGVNIKDYMTHLESHLYWVSYFYQYGKAPWTAEKHGW
jgi:hypothetical protein